MMFNRMMLAALALLGSQGALAEDREWLYNQCNHADGNNDRTLTYTVQLGDSFIGRDAAVGASIGVPFRYVPTLPVPDLQIQCNRENPNIFNPPFVSSLRAVGPIFPDALPTVMGRDLTGKVFQTNIPGVGLAIEMEEPWKGGVQGFEPTGGSRLVPFVGINAYERFQVYLTFRYLQMNVLLIKTGPIPPGVHPLDTGTLFTGDFMPAIPNGFTASFRGTVRQAQCSLDPVDPVSATPVQLGVWSTEDFTGPGSTTPAVPFHINLLNCENNGNESPGNEHGFAIAHIRLEGTAGSAAIAPDLGLFSLGTGSTAAGVSIQLLAADGLTPVKLSDTVPVGRIAATGATQLSFAARFYQLPESTIRPGKAQGALNFTISYR